MNQSLEDLMYQAGLTADGCWDQLDQYDRDAIVRLSHLIVERCSQLIVEQGTDWVDFRPSQLAVRPEYWQMAQHIKQHFGVEK